MPESRPLPEVVARRREVARAGHEGDEARARAGLVDPDPTVRGTALGALERLGALRDDDLRAALRDPHPAVRRRAAEEAGRSRAAGVGAELVGVLADADAGVAEAAASALGELEPPPAGAVAALAAAAGGHDDVLVREAAVAALGSLGDPGGLDAVVAACADVATVRRRAVLALAGFDDPVVETTLERLAGDRDRQTRQAAEDLLHGWGVSGSP